MFCRKSVLRNFAVNYSKFLRTPFLTEHLRWLLLELTHNFMISISICFCNQTWFQNPCVCKMECDCSFVAKLSSKYIYIYIFEKIYVFYKRYIISRKNVFIWKKSFILKNFFTEKNVFLQRKI